MHIRRGKGHKDRFVALPDLTCALRSLWPKQHNPVWLFPNGAGSMESIKNATTHMDRGGVQATMTAVEPGFIFSICLVMPALARQPVMHIQRN